MDVDVNRSCKLLFAFSVGTVKPDLNNWVAYFDYYLPMWACSVALLIGLYLINCFWMSLISRLIYRELAGSGNVAKDGDIRSDSEDED
mmetsp:Transcript_25645/g.101165  ORF Transcript_25645/g.101165 Transcript_25645/m.101165 type:complete len:88 (-) Transcript_25645:868-1131(-)